jgi:hypothetical protein
VLLDAERQRISPALRCASDRIEEAVHGVLSRLASTEAAPGREVYFSYSCRDLREYRETFPSWLMLQAYRLKTADPSKSYRDLNRSSPQPKPQIVTSQMVERNARIGYWVQLQISEAKG